MQNLRDCKTELFCDHQRRFPMGEFTDKAKGTANVAIGKTRAAAGRATENPELVAKGMAQEIKGKAQNIAGTLKGALGDKI
jgi:uncharacterized protein YjbJ (UPF0337 family)